MAYTEDICVDCRDSDTFRRSPKILLSIVQCTAVLWLDLSHADRQHLIVYILENERQSDTYFHRALGNCGYFSICCAVRKQKLVTVHATMHSAMHATMHATMHLI